jgi:hypothetical protein
VPLGIHNLVLGKTSRTAKKRVACPSPESRRGGTVKGFRSLLDTVARNQAGIVPGSAILVNSRLLEYNGK